MDASDFSFKNSVKSVSFLSKSDFYYPLGATAVFYGLTASPEFTLATALAAYGTTAVSRSYAYNSLRKKFHVNKFASNSWTPFLIASLPALWFTKQVDYLYIGDVQRLFASGLFFGVMNRLFASIVQSISSHVWHFVKFMPEFLKDEKSFLTKKPEWIPPYLALAKNKANLFIDYYAAPQKSIPALPLMTQKNYLVFSYRNKYLQPLSFFQNKETNELARKIYAEFTPKNSLEETALALYSHRNKLGNRWNKELLVFPESDEVITKKKLPGNLVLAHKRKANWQERQDATVLENLLQDPEYFVPVTVQTETGLTQVYHDLPNLFEFLNQGGDLQVLQKDQEYLLTYLDAVTPLRQHSAPRNLHKKHLELPLVQDEHYIQAVQRAIQHINPALLAVNVDYHPENRLIYPATQRLVVLDYEDKGKVHPLENVVNALDYKVSRFSSFEQRLPFIELLRQRYALEAQDLALTYQALAFLRADAYARAWNDKEVLTGHVRAAQNLFQQVDRHTPNSESQYYFHAVQQLL